MDAGVAQWFLARRLGKRQKPVRRAEPEQKPGKPDPGGPDPAEQRRPEHAP